VTFNHIQNKTACSAD